MGVHGLWRLIEPSGKPVPLETLENKVLAVDISIWLHQAVKGFQDSKGASVPNAHLLGIYHRVCKLLYFKIKPIFVFDGGVPALKKQTISKRTQSKLRNISEADKIQRQLLSTLLKHTAVSKVLTEKIEASIGNVLKTSSRSTKEDIYRLPPSSEIDSTISSSEDESYSDSTTADSSPTKNWDLHTIDMESVHFKTLPVDVRHEILTDLKETRKQSSWGRLHELPKISDDFSVYQMKRLLKRQAVQTALEEAEKEMGGKSLSLAELESILKDQGVITNQNVGNRIASDDTTKYLLVKDLKQAIEEARKNELIPENTANEETSEVVLVSDNGKLEETSTTGKTKADAEYEDDLKRAIALSLESEPSTSDKNIVSMESVSSSQKPFQKKLNPAEFSFLENFADEDFASSSSEDEGITTERITAKMSSAQSYMLEYSGLTPNEIAKIMTTNVTKTDSKKPKSPKKTILPSVAESCEDISSTIDEKSIKKTDNLNNSDEEGKFDDSVGVMSSSDSNDSEAEPKKSINVVINLDSRYNEKDDLFADIFKSASQKIGDSTLLSNVNIEKPKSISGLDIVVSTTDKFDEKDDLFSDVFLQGEEEQQELKTDNIKMPQVEIRKDQNSINEILSTVKKADENIENKGTVENIGTKEENISKSFNKPNILSQEITTPQRDIRSEHDGKAKQTSQKPIITEQELKQIKDQLQRDQVDLLNEKSTKERMAGNITDQMYQEAQDLLELFGVPYIIAPMEAEAQCAFLDAIELTDGTITDDSDIWLFGGKTVYKNFFNQSKYVMEFRSENISHHFKLTREQMVLLALLVGSDYTVGLQGVGPVTAMEILAAFPPSKGKVNEFSLSHFDLLSGLKEFRSWFTKGKSPGPGRSALKSKLKNLYFTENFPSIQVVQAYLDPTVETSREAFSWSRPNAMALIEFAREKFGWTKTKTEEILNPVLKKLEESKHQKSIKDYFKTSFKVHSGDAGNKMSKRVKSAITNMGRDPSEVLAEELQEEFKKQPMKKPVRKKRSKEAPEFSKASGSKERSHTDSEKSEEKSDKKFEEKSNIKGANKKGKVKLHKLKSDQISSTDEIKADKTQTEIESNEVVVAVAETDITEKINLIRRRRKIKEAKAAVDIKKPKLTKEKKVQFSENIPKDLEVDEEIQLLSQVVSESSQKVEDINKSMEERLQDLNTKSLQTLTLSASTAIPTQPQPSSSNHRPAFRPTRIPRKETIPQKDNDKTMLLRNKLKAIEVFRKGKHGPGFVPKKDRKKRLPKADAELSESSD